MRSTTGLLAGACALSVGANVWQLTSRAPQTERVRATGSRQSKENSPHKGNGRPRLPSSNNGRKEIPPDIAKLDRAALEQRLATAEARLEMALPLEEAFDGDPQSPESEARIRPVLDRVFQTTPGKPPLYTVECHGAVCRLETDVSMNEWQQPFFEDSPGIASNMEVGSRVSYLRLEEPGRAAGIKYSMGVIIEFLTGPATQECKQRNPERGSAELSLHFDAATRKVTVLANGALANTAVGVCLRRVLEDIVARAPAPSEMTAVVEEAFPVTVP